ncbi:hypothetical protein ACFVZC_10415 [Streptomyces marokkonensis]|uniref:Uncharacterized protein n=1 Tax=Streptomyces marokkonensis TaxID=324855 RepID=A0ABW6Q3N5_9ACTN
MLLHTGVMYALGHETWLAHDGEGEMTCSFTLPAQLVSVSAWWSRVRPTVRARVTGGRMC